MLSNEALQQSRPSLAIAKQVGQATVAETVPAPSAAASSSM
jgi:hypothetical protein